MEKTANQIQKERIKDIEEKASLLLERCKTVTLASVNENGYPRICVLTKLKSVVFSEIYFVTSKRSNLNGKATHFEKNSKSSVCYTLDGSSVTLISNIEFINDRNIKAQIWEEADEADKQFFKKGIDDPKFRLLKFHANEATFWIEGKFRTCIYKKA